MGIRIKISADINPTEDDEKVLLAIRNLIGNRKDINVMILEKTNKKEINLHGGLELLDNLRREIITRQLQPLVRAILFRNKRETTSFILLNKQALYANHIVICDSSSESPLGPVKIEINGDKEEDLILAIYWLTEDINFMKISL